MGMNGKRRNSTSRESQRQATLHFSQEKIYYSLLCPLSNPPNRLPSPVVTIQLGSVIRTFPKMVGWEKGGKGGENIGVLVPLVFFFL